MMMMAEAAAHIEFFTTIMADNGKEVHRYEKSKKI